MTLFSKVLVANRGEIACRIIRTLRKFGIASVAVYSEADRHAMHVDMADEAVCIGPAPARESYLNGERILEVARQTGAEAIHPGYGFLSENASFAEVCEQVGICFVGPTADQIRRFGLKHTSRQIAEQCSVPLLPGSGLLRDVEHALAEAQRIGFPVMLKSTAGGGGIGMQLCEDAEQLRARYETVRNLGKNNFKDDGVYLEKFVEVARHIEVQIFGDGRGTVIALGERDCSTQRRNQKVIEETPAPGLTAAQREELCACAVRLGRAVNYRSAGTVEFVFDVRANAFYFLEVNTRLQVEHGVTEMVTGLDLVEWMLRVAADDAPDLSRSYPASGSAIQVRLYAEDAQKNFQPSSGLLTRVDFPPMTRCDHWIEAGTEISPYYDPLLAKIMVHAPNRSAALDQLDAALAATRLDGIRTNLDYLRQVAGSAEFRRGDVWTGFLRGFAYRPNTVEVLSPGTLTTVQDWPGRLGHWAVGVPPSGPMDARSFRLGNRLLGNGDSAAGLEMTLTGATLQFHCTTTICLTGAPMRAKLDGKPVRFGEAIPVAAGQILEVSTLEGAGCRTYLAVVGGFDVPEYLGSRSTFTLGKFGGHGGRALRLGDVLPLVAPGQAHPRGVLDAELCLEFSREWEIGVLYGPHGAPDFFTTEDIATFFATDWEVHFNSARTGVRLIGPKPQWAREDGGEAGLHPSNIHDNAYAIGAIDFTGDMPIILGPDGPSLGGFVCPACVVQGELWKIGQLKAGDKVRFRRLDESHAAEILRLRDLEISTLRPQTPVRLPRIELPGEAPLARLAETESSLAVVYRPAGDDYLLVEYGSPVLDLELRLRVHALMTWLEGQRVPGVIDLTPGIRSLQIHYDHRRLARRDLLALLRQAEVSLAASRDLEVPARIVHLPLSWDDPATRRAIEKYVTGVRPDAPWCPSNIEFIRRINGLGSIEEVQRIVFDASYLVLGLGDVYLGAPVATPLDPRHRLVTTKYNPARTWTPENAVGIGGAYLCVYGMEGPGGYQFVGRTVQMWNRFRSTRDFVQPWLLRFFDQIRFYPVSAEELLQLREDFPRGRFQLRVEETTFRLADYRAFLASIAPDAAAFKSRQQAAFDAERERWHAAGLDQVPAEPEPELGDELLSLPPGQMGVGASLPANVWQVLVQPGARVQQGDKLVVLEAMKMEIPVMAPVSGVVAKVTCAAGRQVLPGQNLVIIDAQ
jgi:urea carboxylase